MTDFRRGPVEGAFGEADPFIKDPAQSRNRSIRLFIEFSIRINIPCIIRLLPCSREIPFRRVKIPGKRKAKIPGKGIFREETQSLPLMPSKTRASGGLTGADAACGIIRTPSRRFLAANCCLCRENEMSEKLRAIEIPVNPNVPQLNPGDTVSVHVKIKEGDKERIQEFRGTIIRLRKGGSQANFTVRRVASHGIGVERTFPLRSPSLDKVVVQKSAKVRRAQLYFLRDLKGKRARLHEKSEGA